MMNPIAFARKFHGISGTELGRRMGLSRDRVSQWEHGYRHPKPENAQIIARILDVDPDWIMGCPQLLQLPGKPSISAPIMRTEYLKDSGNMLYHIVLPDSERVLAVLITPDHQMLTPEDWQEPQPVNASEIDDDR